MDVDAVKYNRVTFNLPSIQKSEDIEDEYEADDGAGEVYHKGKQVKSQCCE